MSAFASTSACGRQKVRVHIENAFGWRDRQIGNFHIWTKGYGAGADARAIVHLLETRSGPPDAALVTRHLSRQGGHFALVVKAPQWTLAAVDRVCSIPLAFGKGAGGWHIDDQAERLRSTIGATQVNPTAARAIAMAGYSIDSATLFQGVEQLGPGEHVLFDGAGSARRHRYYCYRPWRADKPAYEPLRARKALAETTLEIVDAMMRGIGDRILAVPLSAGRDSRLIVSAARHLGYDNVRTFAYGRKGNFEAQASEAIAGKLGYDWQFVPTDTAFMRRHFASKDWDAYWRFADSLQSVPFVQDLPQIQALKRSGYIPDDAVIANGNSGDYISGNHILTPLNRVDETLSAEERRQRITKTLYDKHFALWRALRDVKSEHQTRTALWASIERAGGALGNPADDFGLYEYAEFQDRQCKYVISGQRIYEYLGHEWRMPLWEKALLDFFEMLPLEAKANQRLYADMLEAENWGGVWTNVPVNRKTVRPGWIRPLRWLAMAAHLPLGRTRWHRFEKRYLVYWMEPGSHSAVLPYTTIARDRRGARAGISWHTQFYLESHGLAYDGTTLT